jgi:hypothetical protein
MSQHWRLAANKAAEMAAVAGSVGAAVEDEAVIAVAGRASKFMQAHTAILTGTVFLVLKDGKYGNYGMPKKKTGTQKRATETLTTELANAAPPQQHLAMQTLPPQTKKKQKRAVATCLLAARRPRGLGTHESRRL